MKYLMIAVVFVSFLITSLHATRQVDDILFFDNKKLMLELSWSFPSPLQCYFSQNELKYPFKYLSSANQRGHKATWEIINNKLFLKEILIEKISTNEEGIVFKRDTFTPQDYNILSKDPYFKNSKLIFADWFSGFLTCYYIDNNNNNIIDYLFQVEKGIVINALRYVEVFLDDDLKKAVEFIVRQDKYKDISDSIVKNEIFAMSDNYYNYYINMGSFFQDTVIYNNKLYKISQSDRNTPLLSYYQYKHLEWPFNWNNIEKCGTPFCKWSLKSGRLYLEKIEIKPGDFLSDDDNIETITFKEVFPKFFNQERIIANWVSGNFVLRSSTFTGKTSDEGYRIYDYEILIVKIKDGFIVEQYELPKDFELHNIPSNLPKGLQNIIDEEMEKDLSSFRDRIYRD